MSKAYVSAALRRLVCNRANFACEYCLMPEVSVLVPHEIDHIIAEKHGGQTNENNLALACTICNKYKGSDLASIDPMNGEIVRLYNPRRDRWREHFKVEKGEIIPLTAIGRVTVKLLQINRPERVEERRLLSQANILDVPES
ncbi:HNH endonuclease [Aerosakkonemataceae cyanobacterium BLCC-F50]|uniref:HNH endonuclease n=1 Tax=Floridaenema flaviceps BLCC-F50 TaxID=3153642 RepID=A0ABV4XK03_9CYAN